MALRERGCFLGNSPSRKGQENRPTITGLADHDKMTVMSSMSLSYFYLARSLQRIFKAEIFYTEVHVEYAD